MLCGVKKRSKVTSAMPTGNVKSIKVLCTTLLFGFGINFISTCIHSAPFWNIVVEKTLMLLKATPNLPEKEARIITVQIFQGLVYLNKKSQKTIHYDLKPIMFCLMSLE
ncbi:unnamed protein product [Arabidopsis halleri]